MRETKDKQYIILFGKPSKKKMCPSVEEEILQKNCLPMPSKKKEAPGIFEDTIEYKFDPYKDANVDKTAVVFSSFFTSLKKIFLLFTSGKKKNHHVDK